MPAKSLSPAPKTLTLHITLPLLPGSLSTARSTCGKPNCACKAKPPKLHGPYYRWTGLRQRFYAPSALVSGNFVHSAEYMRLSLNPGGGGGGTCFGDSGGPDLKGGTDTVLAVNSYVTNGNCAGVTYSQRVDLPDILSFINSF